MSTAAAPHFTAHARTQAQARTALTYTRASNQAQKNSNNIIIIIIIVTRRRARVVATDHCARLLSYNAAMLYTSIEVCVATDGLADHMSAYDVIIVMSYNYLKILPANGMFRLTNLVL